MPPKLTYAISPEESHSCGSCSLCCKILEIEPEPATNFSFKPYNTWCKNCKPGLSAGGCQIYENRPKACEQFKCLWLQSQERPEVPSMSYDMKPSKSHCIFVEDDKSPDVSFVFVDPNHSDAYKKEPVRSLLITVAQRGRTVIVVIGSDRYLMTKDRPTIKLTEGQLYELTQNGKAIKVEKDGGLRTGYPPKDKLLESTHVQNNPTLVHRRRPKQDVEDNW